MAYKLHGISALVAKSMQIIAFKMLTSLHTEMQRL